MNQGQKDKISGALWYTAVTTFGIGLGFAGYDKAFPERTTDRTERLKENTFMIAKVAIVSWGAFYLINMITSVKK